MSNINKCRVCLMDGAKHEIFDSIENKEGIYSKLFQCFKEEVKDIEGYPRKICESCNSILNTLCNFITKYMTSCKKLEDMTIVKKEMYSDNEDLNNDIFKETIELEICKDEPDSDSVEQLDDSLWNIPMTHIKKQKADLTYIQEKLKGLKDIKFQRKPSKKHTRNNSKVATSILEAEFDWNGESLKSSKMKAPKKEYPKEKQKKPKLVLPKPPKVPVQPVTKLCDICGEIVKENKLSCHKKAKHLNVPVKCPKCPRTLVSTHYLKRHDRRVHAKKTFICDICGSGFAFKTGLKVHMRGVHLKPKRSIKSHVCDKCDKAFVTALSLTIHERSAHTGLRPAHCTECGASFFHENYLKEHMRLHTGETPFKCPICGRGYAQRGNMRSHVSHNHRLADLSEEVIKSLKPSWFKYLKKP